jgi:glycosyltransferase involved in cell wall biosynthesis/aminoglycoside phosphotransferase (APT) family kinase protein
MIKVLRPAGLGSLISGRVFDQSFVRNLHPEVSVLEVDLAQWLDSIFDRQRLSPNDQAVHEAFTSATSGFDFLCPNYLGIPLTPLLLYVRNQSRARIRLLLIAHAPGAYGLEWALLRPLLRNDDLIIAPINSARDVIEFLMPELAKHTRVVPHSVRPLARWPAHRRRHIVSLTRLHPSKLLHRQIEAFGLLRNRGYRELTMRIAGPLQEPDNKETSPYARSLLQKIARLRLEDSVDLTGEIAGERAKSRFLAEARLLINLSVTTEESFGKAIIEALSAGVPVVATHWNGFPETVGAGGRCVPVDASLVGMDVSAEGIADAVQSILENPPGAELCRAEAERFHPHRIRQLYRRELEAVMDVSAHDFANAGIPAAQEPAAPANGLLAKTAPLMQMSWQDLFSLHLDDVARLRESLCGEVQRTISDADELRSLLIIGIRAPLSRQLAEVNLQGMDQPVGKGQPSAPADGFLARIAAGALSRATLSSRLACALVVARRGGPQRLRQLLDAMRDEGLRSWGLEYLEVEALRLNREYEIAFRISTARKESLYWGELVADRLRQLASVCRDWQRPELALSWLHEWLERFPDSPDSGPVYVDLCTNALAAGLTFVSEARQALQCAQQLLGQSVHLTALDSSVRRLERLNEQLPWHAIEKAVSTVASVRPIGRTTFLIDAAKGKFVLKQIRADRDPDRYLDLLRQVAEKLRGTCPSPLTVLNAKRTSWYVLFEWVSGRAPAAAALDDLTWRAAVDLLRTLADCDIVPDWQLESTWLDRLEQGLSDEPVASFILNTLRRELPQGRRTLAHGDFSPQNFVLTENRIVLIDWEEVGSAPPGFDAGWMLAHARVGAGAHSHAEILRVLTAAGFPESNLRWFERLGLLRLLFRARSLCMQKEIREQVRAAVDREVYRCAETIGWRNDAKVRPAAQMR